MKTNGIANLLAEKIPIFYNGIFQMGERVKTSALSAVFCMEWHKRKNELETRNNNLFSRILVSLELIRNIMYLMDSIEKS